MIGFGNNNNKEESMYDFYVGKPGHYGVGGVTATGVLKEINFKKGYLLVQPSIVGSGKVVRLEKNIPSLIELVGGPISCRPLQDGDLERIVEENKID